MPIRRTLFHRLSGQSLPIVVLMLALIFMIVGMGIDGGLLYAQRRLMQNTADAACLAAATRLAIGNDSADARTAAEQVIAANLGPTPGSGANAPGTLSYNAIADVYTPVDGAGAGLTRGIELSGPEIRVALQSPAFTYFLRLLGQPEYTVAARARCDASAGGGGVPFAVARWRGYDKNNKLDTVPSTDESLSSQVGGKKGLETVRDILAPASAAPLASASGGGEWPDWGTVNFPGTPASGTGVFRDPASLATSANPGVEIVLAGQGAQANGGGSFTGPVLLDIRNLTFGTIEYYNGIDIDKATNTNKDFITRQILEGYSGPLVPPGTQLAYTSGVSAGQVQKPFSTRYQVGDTVNVLIFNGTIYSAADFTTSFPTPADGEEVKNVNLSSFVGDFPPDCDFNSVRGAYMSDELPGLQPWTYRMTIEPFRNKAGTNQDPYASTFAMRAFSSQSGVEWNELQVRWNGGNWGSLNNNGVPVTAPVLGAGPAATTYALDLRQTVTGACQLYEDPLDPYLVTGTVTAPIKPYQGALTLYLEAKDKGTGLRRGHYALLGLNASGNDFWVFTPLQVAYAPLELSTKTEDLAQEFRIQRTDGTLLRANSSGVSVGAPAWFAVDENNEAVTAMGSAPSGITAAVNVRSNTNFIDVAVEPTATAGRSYYVRFPISYSGKTHWIWYYLSLKPPTSSAKSLNQYVYAIGYANFEITKIDANDIFGRAVSGLLRPGDVIAGMQPRLVPWED
jgi:hypothetical protein